MPAKRANCLVCGEPIAYWEQAQEVVCVICGKKETGHSICTAGHYVCNACHRAEGVNYIIGLCTKSTSTNPIAIMNEAMDDKSVYPNGPEHHTLVGAALIAAYANAGGKDPADDAVDKNAALAELRTRSLQVPGGTCGFWGTCGAAVSSGQALSILTGSTPLKQEPWAQCQRLTSAILGRMADIGGPRCCKRTSYISVITAVPFINQLLGSEMTLPEEVTCSFFQRNAECRKRDCPFFPGASEDAKAAFRETRVLATGSNRQVEHRVDS